MYPYYYLQVHKEFHVQPYHTLHMLPWYIIVAYGCAKHIQEHSVEPLYHSIRLWMIWVVLLFRIPKSELKECGFKYCGPDRELLRGAILTGELRHLYFGNCCSFHVFHGKHFSPLSVIIANDQYMFLLTLYFC